MKTIFKYNGRQYSYKIIDGNVITFEIMGTYDDEILNEVENEKITDKDWEYIFKYFEECEKEL